MALCVTQCSVTLKLINPGTSTGCKAHTKEQTDPKRDTSRDRGSPKGTKRGTGHGPHSVHLRPRNYCTLDLVSHFALRQKWCERDTMCPFQLGSSLLAHLLIK